MGPPFQSSTDTKCWLKNFNFLLWKRTNKNKNCADSDNTLYCSVKIFRQQMFLFVESVDVWRVSYLIVEEDLAQQTRWWRAREMRQVTHTHTGSDDCWATLLGMQRTVPSSTANLVDTFHFHCSWPARRQLLRNTCRGGAAKSPAENQLALVVGAAASSLSVEPSCEKKVSCVFNFG